jgi:hypothetical protein
LDTFEEISTDLAGSHGQRVAGSNLDPELKVALFGTSS